MGGYVHYTIRHMIDTDAPTFWNRIFFDEEYNRKLCIDCLKFTHFQILEQTREENGVVVRRTDNSPQVEIPKVVRRVFGDVVRYEEKGRFDPVEERWVFEVIPAMAKDKIQTSGEMWVELRGEKTIERIVSIDTTVQAFGIGKMVENLIATQTRSFYDRAASFTNQWIRDQGLT